MSKDYKTLKEKGLISECGKFIIDEQVNNENLAGKPSNQTIENLAEKPNTEASVPLSEVKKMMEEMEQRFIQNQQKATPEQPKNYANLQPQAFDIIDKIPEFKDWEVKEREYRLKDNQRPITRSIQRAHTKERALQYFDKETQKT